jgi:hypothetical protein
MYGRLSTVEKQRLLNMSDVGDRCPRGHVNNNNLRCFHFFIKKKKIKKFDFQPPFF